MLKLKLQHFGHLMGRTDSLEKNPDAGKDWGQEEKGMTEDEIVEWHHWLDGHEFEQALGDGEGQGSLVCCNPWVYRVGHDWSDLEAAAAADSVLKGREITSLARGPYSQSYGFSSIYVWMWELDHKERWAPKNWCFWTVVLKKTLESPLICKEIKPVNPKGNQSWLFIGRTDAETPIMWPPDTNNWLIGKAPDALKDWKQK